MVACRGFGWERPGLPLRHKARAALGKEPVHRKSTDFRLEPDSMCESGFAFWGYSDDASRQVWTTNYRPADLCYRPLKFPLRLLPLRRPGKLPRRRANSFLGRV